MKDKLLAMQGNELEITLAQRDATVYFTKKHIADLKIVIEVDQATIEESPKPAMGGSL